MNDKTPDSHLATAAQIQAEPEVPIAHPMNPNSEVYLQCPTSFEDFVKKP